MINTKFAYITFLFLLFSNVLLAKGILPDIYSLQEYLKQQSKKSPVAKGKLIFIRDSKEIRFSKSQSVYLEKISIEMPIKNLKEKLKIIEKKYLHQVETPVLINMIEQNIISRLEQFGYYKAKIISKRKINIKGELEYQFKIDSLQKCRVKEFIFPFNLPEETESSIQKEVKCNLDDIREQIYKLSNNLKKSGFYQSSLEFKSLEYQEDKSSAKVYLAGNLGVKTTYELIFTDKNSILNWFGKSNPLDDMDINFSSTEAIKAELIHFYKNEGYNDIKIQTNNFSENNANHIELHITLGDSYKIDELAIEGNYFFTKDFIKDVLEFDAFFHDNTLNSKNIEKYTDLLKSLYENHGFWDAKVVSDIQKNTLSKKTLLTLSVVENKQIQLYSVSLEGNTFFDQKLLINLVQDKISKPLIKKDIITYIDQLKSMYLEKGFYFVEIKPMIIYLPESKEKIRNTKLVVEIQEGKRSKFGIYSIVGLVSTDSSIVEREISFQEGEWYNSKKIAETQSNLLKLGLFSNVSISPVQRFSTFIHPEVIDFQIEVSEASAGKLNFGPGYNLERGLNYTAEISYNNLLGKNKRVSLKGTLSQEQNQSVVQGDEANYVKMFLGRKVSLTYVEPFVFTRWINGRVALLHKGTADQIWKISDSLESSLDMDIGHIISNANLSLFHTLKQTRDVGTQQQSDTLVSTGLASIGSLGLRFSLDRRDDLKWTTKGYLINTELNFANPIFIGEFSYFKYYFHSSVYFEIFKNLVFATAFSITAYQDIKRHNNKGADVLPSSERLLAGGQDKVRGFAAQLGPYVKTTRGQEEPFGGTNMNILKLDLRYQIVPQSWGLSLFSDIGNAFFSRQEADKFRERFKELDQNVPEKDQLKAEIYDNRPYSLRNFFKEPKVILDDNYISIGLGVNFYTLIGPLTAAYAIPVHEPISTQCQAFGACYSRKKSGGNLLTQGKIEFNINTEF